MALISTFLDAHAAGMMKADAQGRLVVYPWGVMFKGRVIAAPEDAQSVRAEVRKLFADMFKRFFIAVGAMGVAALTLRGLPDVAPDVAKAALALIGLVAFGSIVVDQVRFSRRLRRFPVSGERLGLGEAQRNQVAALSRGWLIGIAVFSGLLAALLLVLLTIAPSEKLVAHAVLSILMAIFFTRRALLAGRARPS